MKIGQIKIDLYIDPAHGKFYLTTAPEEVQKDLKSTEVENSASEEVQQNPKYGIDALIAEIMSQEEVQLDPDSDDFDEKKSELKAAGYFYNRSSKTWRKKKKSATTTPTVEADWFGDATEIELSQDDPEFVAKKESLKGEGFKWDVATKTWRKPKPQIRNNGRNRPRSRVSKMLLLSALALFAGMS